MKQMSEQIFNEADNMNNDDQGDEVMDYNREDY